MFKIVKLTKELMKKHLDKITSEVQEFKYQNWKRENYLTDLPSKWEYSILSLSNDEISGFSINSEKNNVFYIHFFYVFQKFRGSKLGTELIEHCLKIAGQQKKGFMRLKCHRDNIEAINFYSRNKFSIIDIDPDNNLYLMERRLN